MTDNISEHANGSNRKCPACYGRGKIRTGGCTMEHGINTFCDDYGCPPIIYEKCETCGGKGDIPRDK